MSGFIVHLQGATQYERLDNVVSFVGEDRSGSFGVLGGHCRLITTLVFGLARVRYADGRRDYLALPGAVASFDHNELTLSTRRYLRGDDCTRISQALREELAEEEQLLVEFKHSLEQMERAMMLRLWRMGRGEGIRS
ncbi:MAG: F0F1 ATP synthase subunit epsilon [Gammaproteobacteria bacterium]|nr:F0F1 ATP synthase subunit epsilon [Gammaproteobacteria bacterium]